MSFPGLTKVKRLAIEMIEYEMNERIHAAEQEIARIYGYLATEGALSSSSLINQVQDFCRSELKLRSGLIMKNVLKAIENTNIEFSKYEERELVNFATEELGPTLFELNQYLDKSRQTAREEKTRDLSSEFRDEVRRMSIQCEDFRLKRERLAQENKWYKNRTIQAAIIGGIVGAIVGALISRLLASVL
jgi:uncharacterized protein (DUF2164 family)